MNLKFFSAVAFCFLASSCGQETTGSTDHRDRDRETEKAQGLYDDYQKASGIYVGELTSGSVRLTVQTAWNHDPSAGGTSGTIPQPILVGVLNIYPDLKIAGNEPLQAGLSIDTGTYSDQNKKMALVFRSNGATSRLICDVTIANLTKCQWFTSHGVSSLALHKVEDSSSEAAVHMQPPGSYAGQTDDYDIKASFETATTSAGSGQGIRSLITAHFIFFDRKSTSQRPDRGVMLTAVDGAYDPQTDSLSFTIPGDTPILMNCRRLSNVLLKCQMNSIAHLDFDLNAL